MDAEKIHQLLAELHNELSDAERLPPELADEARALVTELCAGSAEIATALVGGFGIPDTLLPEIAHG